MSDIQVVEVGLRDGLQNEKAELSLADRFQIVKQLSFAGFKRIELGAFVSPRMMPQMKVTPLLVEQVLSKQAEGLLPKETTYFAFVPNIKGFERAVSAGLKEVSFFVSCTESFSKKNINMSIEESLEQLQKICQQANSLGVRVRVYLSATFVCPYEGKTSFSQVVSLAERILQQKEVFELALSDTIGKAFPSDVHKLMDLLLKKVPVQKIALHLHDTYSRGLENVVAGLENGVRVFDSSIGGIGGCPYAPGASGNIATEKLISLLEEKSLPTGIPSSDLTKTTQLLQTKLKTGA